MTITRITCGDLAALGGRWDRLYQHDPRKQNIALDALCHCHPDRLGASLSTDGAHVECRELTRFPVGQDYVLVLCCVCAPRVRDALRGVRDRALYEWLMAQCDEAVAYQGTLRRRHERRVAAYTGREVEAL